MSKKLLKYFGFVAIPSCLLIFYLFNTDYRINEFIKQKLSFVPHWGLVETTANHIFNLLDFSKVFYSKPDRHFINLDLSYDDIRSFDQTYRCSSLFLDDRCKSWRKARFSHEEFEGKVKARLSGTSMTPRSRSNGLWESIRMKLDDEDVYNPAAGGYSFSIKTNNDSLFKNIRRFSLLSPYDDWSFFQQVMNKFARKIGLVTTYGRPFILRINGVDSGVYLFQERISKNLLERDYGITNFAILKSNDDWSKIPLGHISNTDYSAEDKEQNGISAQAVGVAQNQLRRLFSAIGRRDLAEVGLLIDIKYLAALSAFELLYGTKHSSYGDNRRYIYNFSDGRFYPSFRMESNPVLLSVEQNLIPKIADDNGVDQLIDLLSENDEFIEARLEFLIKLVSLKAEIIGAYEMYLAEYGPILNTSSRPTLNIRMRNTKGLAIFKKNMETLENFLIYNKIFVTKVSSMTSCFFSILVDSFSPISVNGKYLHRGLNRLDGEDDCSGDLIFKNEATDSVVSEKDTFFNFEYLGAQLADFKESFSFLDDGETIYIESGRYVVRKSIEFPRNRNVVIAAGTEILIEKDVSMVFHNGFVARGFSEEPIIFGSVEGSDAFGSVLIKANNKPVEISHLIVSGGSDGVIDNTLTTGQFVIVHGDVKIEDSHFSFSDADDGLNIKYSNVELRNNIFEKNLGDQVDLDYCTGVVTNNRFSVDTDSASQSASDGLDVSGSNLQIQKNRFFGFTDKAISVGEKSIVVITENLVGHSKIGVAVKDGSRACLSGNTFTENSNDVAAYVKKLMYLDPTVASNDNALLQSYKYVVPVELCDEFN